MMDLSDKKQWLETNGSMDSSEFGNGIIRTVWEPDSNPAMYVESCYTDTMDEAYSKTYDNVKQELFNRCG